MKLKSKYYKTYRFARFYGAKSSELYNKREVSIRRFKKFEKAFCESIKDLPKFQIRPYAIS